MVMVLARSCICDGHICHGGSGIHGGGSPICRCVHGGGRFGTTRNSSLPCRKRIVTQRGGDPPPHHVVSPAHNDKLVSKLNKRYIRVPSLAVKIVWGW